MPAASARVIVLAGPSGAGNSRLAERLGLPVLRPDDFHRSGVDPVLPVIERGPNAAWHPFVSCWRRLARRAVVRHAVELGGRPIRAHREILTLEPVGHA